MREDDIDLILSLARVYQVRDGQRRGQALFNATHTVTRLMPPSEADPFYDDRLVVPFWEWLVEQIK